MGRQLIPQTDSIRSRLTSTPRSRATGVAASLGSALRAARVIAVALVATQHGHFTCLSPPLDGGDAGQGDPWNGRPVKRSGSAGWQGVLVDEIPIAIAPLRPGWLVSSRGIAPAARIRFG